MADPIIASGTTSLAEYDLLRKKAQSAGLSAQEQAQQALKRRFAAMGNLQSGALVKQEQLANKYAQEQTQSAIEDINAKEQTELQRRKELQQAQDFASEQAQKERDFQASENQANRAFATSERLSSQDYTSGQNEAQRKFLNEQRLGGQEFTAAQNQLMQNWQSTENALSRAATAKESSAQRALTEKLANQDLAFQKEVQQYNIANTAWAQGYQERELQYNKQQNYLTNLINTANFDFDAQDMATAYNSLNSILSRYGNLSKYIS